MGEKYLIDSNAVIEFLANSLPDSGSNWLQLLVEKESHYLSVINKIELLGFKGPEGEMQILHEFVNSSQVISLTEEIVAKTIELRIEHKIKLPDAIIASTSLIHGLSLITRNLSDFINIEGLVCINPHLI